MTCLSLLLVLWTGIFVFLHNPFHRRPQQQKVSPAVAAFIGRTSAELSSYDDGSCEAAIEEQERNAIAADLLRLEQAPFSGPASDDLMQQIQEEVSNLHHWDGILQGEPCI